VSGADADGPPADPDRVDVLRFETPDGPEYRTVAAGRGSEIVLAHEREARKRRQMRSLLLGVVAVVVLGAGVALSRPVVGAGLAALVGVVAVVTDSDRAVVPELVAEGLHPETAAAEYDPGVRAGTTTT